MSNRCATRLLVASTVLGFATLASATLIPTTTLIDEPLATNGNCTLREAIAAATNNAAHDLCPAGSDLEPDVVELFAGIHSWTQGQQPLGATEGSIVLRGPATTPPSAQINIDPVGSGRFIRMFSGVDLTIENVDLRNGDVRTNADTRTGGALTGVDLTDASLTLRNVVLQGNRAGLGGGLFFETLSSDLSSTLVIERSVIQSNLAEISDVVGTARGGGVHLRLQGATTARIVDSTILTNGASSTLAGNDAVGGAIFVGLSDEASFEMRRVQIVGNEADAGAGRTPWGAGAVLQPAGDSTVVVEDVRFEANNLIGPFAGPSGPPPSALDLSASFSGSFLLDRIEIAGGDAGELAYAVRLQSSTGEPSLARNVLVAHGPQRAVLAVNAGGELELGHFTVSGHSVQGVELARNFVGVLRLDNSIVYGNGTNLVLSGAPTVDPSSLVGIDPLFVDAAGGDFRLQELSPALDFGDATLTSVGTLDLDHAPRVAGLDTDAGAYERDGLFGDGFESGDRGAWSSTAP